MAQAQKGFDAAVTGWRPYGVTLSPAQRQGLLHPRVGAAPHMSHVVEIATTHGIAIEGIPLEGLANDLALIAALRPFEDAFDAGRVLLDHTAAQAESEAWNAFLAYYGALRGMAKHQPTLAAELAPVVAFMATGPRAAAAVTDEAAPEAPPAPTPAEAAAAPARARATGKRAMENKVGDEQPSDAEAKAMLAGLTDGLDAWRPFGVVLTKAQQKALHRPRVGAEPHIERVEALATKYNLAIAGIPLEGMKEDLALSAMLRAPRASMRAGQHLIGDTLGQAESEAWEAFLAYYGTLSGIAKHQPALAAELAPVVDFMSTRPRAGG